jgi:hypothetical protein
MEEGKFLASRCGEITSLFRNACQDLGINALLISGSEIAVFNR